MISSALVFSSQFRSVCLFHISYYTVRHLHACIPFFPSIRGSRDKPREFNLKSNLYYYYSCFFPPFYTLFLYLNNAMVCQVHNCMQSLSTLFVPIHAGSSTAYLANPIDHCTTSGKSPSARAICCRSARASYPLQSLSFVSLAANPGSPQTLTAPYPRRPSLRGSKRTFSPFPVRLPPSSI
jgi:hypothetical protein